MRFNPAYALLPLILVIFGKQELEPYEIYKVTKSDTTIDCKGGSFNDGKLTEIRVISDIKNVTIKNCKLRGSIRIYGLGMNGEADKVRTSSYTAGHTERAQKAAPSNVLISNMKIEGVQRIPVYISPGSTKVTIENTEFTGTTDSTVIYMDAESGYNTIRNNTFDVSGNYRIIPIGIREVIAVDGSAYNSIIGNKFKTASGGGGIHLYRNCGEGGTVRHQSPQFNVIANNDFNLSGLDANGYGIWLGSRNGGRSYCNDDKGYKFGSSINDGDFANHNTVKDNTFTGSSRTVKDDGKNNVIK
jgi:hypothetical protein